MRYLFLSIIFLWEFCFADECYDKPLEEVWLEQEKILIGKVLSAKLVEKQGYASVIEYQIENINSLKGEIDRKLVMFENPFPHARLPVGSVSLIMSEYNNVISFCPYSGPFDIELKAPEGYEEFPLFKEEQKILFAREIRALRDKYPLTKQSTGLEI